MVARGPPVPCCSSPARCARARQGAGGLWGIGSGLRPRVFIGWRSRASRAPALRACAAAVVSPKRAGGRFYARWFVLSSSVLRGRPSASSTSQRGAPSIEHGCRSRFAGVAPVHYSRPFWLFSLAHVAPSLLASLGRLRPFRSAAPALPALGRFGSPRLAAGALPSSRPSPARCQSPGSLPAAPEVRRGAGSARQRSPLRCPPPP